MRPPTALTAEESEEETKNKQRNCTKPRGAHVRARVAVTTLITAYELVKNNRGPLARPASWRRDQVDSLALDFFCRHCISLQLFLGRLSVYVSWRGGLPPRHTSPAKRARQSTRPSRTPVSTSHMLVTARSALRIAPALRVSAATRVARGTTTAPIRRRGFPTFARASLGDPRARSPISSPIGSPRLGSVFASRGRGLRRAASEGDVEGKRDEEDLGQSSVAEADADTDAYNVAEEMPDTIPYKSRDSADEDDENDDIKLPGAEVNEDAVKPAKGKDRAYTPFFPCSV